MKRSAVGTLLWFAVWQAFAGPILIGYTNAVSVSNLSPAVMQQAGSLRWFFAHASVGENIMSGLESLHAGNPAFYPLTRTPGEAAPPATTSAGTVYDYYRGNPGWQQKVDDFSGYVSNGWHYPRVDVVLNKFCFIDPDADVNYYLAQSTLLERTNPRTWYIYATIPLTTGEDFDNYRRNVFNDTLRAWVSAHNRVLFDIADIEAHDTHGVAQTFTYNQRLCQKLYSGYTSDGGHLETTQAQQTVAKGIYALGAALLDDGVPAINLQVCGHSEGTFQLQFYAGSNIQYAVERCTNLGLGAWQTLVNLPPQGSSRTVWLIDCTASSPWGFYRVRAQPP